MQRSNLKLKLIVNHRAGPSDSSGAMPLRGRSGALRAEPNLRSSQAKPPAAIAGPSENFIRRGRNPDLDPPAWRFVPTIKSKGDIVI